MPISLVPGHHHTFNGDHLQYLTITNEGARDVRFELRYKNASPQKRKIGGFATNAVEPKTFPVKIINKGPDVLSVGLD